MSKITSSTLRLPRELRFRIKGGQIIAQPSPRLGDFVAGAEIVDLLRLIDALHHESAGNSLGSEALHGRWERSVDEARRSLPPKKQFQALIGDLVATGLLEAPVFNAKTPGENDERGAGLFADGWIQWAMLADETRLRCYDQAIATMIRKGDIALDVGAGSGVLSHFLLKHGAGHVYAIEESAIAARIPRTLARCDGGRSQGKLTVLACQAADAGQRLAGQNIGLVVSELFGHDPYSEGLVPTLRAVQKMVPAGARYVPQRVRVKAQFARLSQTALSTSSGGALAERLLSWKRTSTVRRSVEGTEGTEGAAQAAAGAGVVPTEDSSPYDDFRRAYRAAEDWSTLSFAYALREQDFRRTGPELLLHECTLNPVPPPGTSQRTRSTAVRIPPLSPSSFLMIWFEADLCPGVTISSCPGTRSFCSHWNPIIMPLLHTPEAGLPAQLDAQLDGDECHLNITLRASDRVCAAR